MSKSVKVSHRTYMQLALEQVVFHPTKTLQRSDILISYNSILNYIINDVLEVGKLLQEPPMGLLQALDLLLGCCRLQI